MFFWYVCVSVWERRWPVIYGDFYLVTFLNDDVLNEVYICTIILIVQFFLTIDPNIFLHVPETTF